MKQIGEIGFGNRIPTNDNNVNRNIVNNINNVTSSKYGLDRSKFTPNTEESQLAEKIATYFQDLNNFAFYMYVVKKFGLSKAYQFWVSHKQEEQEKKGTKYEFRDSKRYFAWKFKRNNY